MISAMICRFCSEPVNVNDENNYVEVSSWVNGPKLDGPKLRTHTGRVAHEKCVTNLVHGQAPDQPVLFAPQDVLTDDPGEIFKITGPGSVSDPETYVPTRLPSGGEESVVCICTGKPHSPECPRFY